MDRLLAQAQAAFDSGRIEEAVDHLTEAVDANPARRAEVYRALLTHLYQRQRYAEAEVYGRLAVTRYPDDFDLWNLLGVVRRRLLRPQAALEALDRALELRSDDAARFNRANTLLDLGQADRAVEAFAEILGRSPESPEILRQLGRAELKLGQEAGAFAHLRSAVRHRPAYADAWLDMALHLEAAHRFDEAERICDEALAANPADARLAEVRAVSLRRAGRLRAAEDVLRGWLAGHPQDAWAHAQLGGVVAERDRTKGNQHLRRAVELAPDKLEYAMSLAESLARTRTAGEGAHLEEAHRLARRAMATGRPGPGQLQIAHELYQRVCAFDDVEALGGSHDLGRTWAETDRHTALFMLMSRVETDDDRRDLMAHHRLAGERMEVRAAADPILRPPSRPPGGKLRLGLMSSDLRMHPVGSFALPLFEHPDPRFEVFVYAFQQVAEDARQAFIASRVTAYRWWPDVSSRDAAQRIADDDLDMLIELGGSTQMNRLEVMAWKPAPRQASWLGYPHSAGLAAIDGFVCDPHARPPDPAFMMERPLVMPRTWVAVTPAMFGAADLADDLPQDRAGVVTFGTANAPHKFSRRVFRAWARIAAAVPGSRFAFLRPEAGAETFRRNVEAAFVAEGVTADRLIWRTSRGGHMPHYNEVDISLDTFPLTGGTTTTDALWMGVPVVSLVGPAFYERLSFSLLSSVGLADLCAADLDAYHEIAVSLAADTERRRELRRTIRDRILQGPLGQTEAFARDFYDLVWRTVRDG